MASQAVPHVVERFRDPSQQCGRRTRLRAARQLRQEGGDRHPARTDRASDLPIAQPLRPQSGEPLCDVTGIDNHSRRDAQGSSPTPTTLLTSIGTAAAVRTSRTTGVVFAAGVVPRDRSVVDGRKPTCRASGPVLLAVLAVRLGAGRFRSQIVRTSGDRSAAAPKTEGRPVPQAAGPDCGGPVGRSPGDRHISRQAS